MKRQSRKPGRAVRPNDAIALAAFQNFGIDVERLLVRIYVTNPKTYARMIRLMRRVLVEIYEAGTDPELRRKAQKATRRELKRLSEVNCPDGYLLCADGLCAEVCNIDFTFEE